MDREAGLKPLSTNEGDGDKKADNGGHYTNDDNVFALKSGFHCADLTIRIFTRKTAHRGELVLEVARSTLRQLPAISSPMIRTFADWSP